MDKKMECMMQWSTMKPLKRKPCHVQPCRGALSHRARRPVLPSHLVEICKMTSLRDTKNKMTVAGSWALLINEYQVSLRTGRRALGISWTTLGSQETMTPCPPRLHYESGSPIPCSHQKKIKLIQKRTAQ